MIELAPYSPDWRAWFESERAVLASAFPPSSFRIEHIGSTAVPGLGAKPIVDVLVGARTLAEIDSRIPAVEALGYRYDPEHEVVLPQRRFFAKPATPPRRFHLHAVARQDPFFTEHLLFRDALRADPQLAQRYFSLKAGLAACFGDDREGYAEAKSSFIQAALRHARATTDDAAGA